MPVESGAAAVRRAFVDGPYGQLHLRIARPGVAKARPLVCFHLSPGSGRMYAPLLAEMGRDRVAVAPDTPGFGESGPPPAPPTIGDYAAAMGRLLDALALDAVDVLGYHTGSKIAVELALQHPERVRHLVLVAAPVYTPEELARQKESMGQPRPLAADGSHLLRAWEGLWGWRGPGQTIEMVQQEVAESLRGGPIAWWGHHAAFAYHHAEHLPRVQQPTLVLCPDDDLKVPTLRARSLIRNGRLQELPGWGHGLLALHTAELAALLRDFLDMGA